MIANDPSTRVQAFASYNADYSQSPPTWIETEPIVFADGEGPDPTNPLVTSLNTFDVGGKEMLVFWVYNRNNLAYVESTTGPIVGWSAGEWKGPQSPLPGQTMALSNNDTGHVQYMNTAVWSNGSGSKHRFPPFRICIGLTIDPPLPFPVLLSLRLPCGLQ